ncbi:MAG: cyclic nucleotide-binding domain-containing protein [Planctomycetota bacterium]
MTAPLKTVTLKIDGKDVTVPEGTSIWDAAQTVGIPIPVLCHKPPLTPIGVCRACVVEVKGARVFAASCVRPCESNMEVTTSNDRLERSRKMLVELLLADHPVPCDRHKETHSCELELLAEKLGILKAPVDELLANAMAPAPYKPRFESRAHDKQTASPCGSEPADLSKFLFAKGHDLSNVDIAIDHSACIVCDRCVRACTDVKHNNVIGRMGKGYATSISFDMNKPMGQSSCVNCGECMISCPTGAITSQAEVMSKSIIGKAAGKLGATNASEVLSVEELIKMPMFSAISPEFLKRNQGSILLRKFKKGDIVCREGEFGSTAFYILSGKAEVFLNTPIGQIKSDKTKENSSGIFGMLKKFTGGLTRTKTDEVRENSSGKMIRNDGPTDLSLDHPIAMLQEEDLFGEMTCMSFQPRSATVRATEECTIIEMLRNVLQTLQKNKKFKDKLDKNYRERALAQHLRSVPIFKDLDESFIKQLKDRVELLRFDAGQVIVKQGDPADAFYLIRVGCVKISQSHPGGEMVLTYLGRGEYFGEMGLLKGGPRTASCTALDHVEVVCIRKVHFDFMLSWYDSLRKSFEAEAAKREKQASLVAKSAPDIPLTNFLSQGLMHAQSLLLLDLEKCTRCDECVRACSDAHDGVTRLVREGMRFDKFLVPTSCRSCMDPLCMVGCPVGSIRRKETLEIIIEDWCVGCGLCAEQCPYGNINMHQFPGEGMVDDPERPGFQKANIQKKAVTCDLCTDLSTPSCVYACPHEAAQRVNAREFFADRILAEAQK